MGFDLDESADLSGLASLLNSRVRALSFFATESRSAARDLMVSLAVVMEALAFVRASCCSLRAVFCLRMFSFIFWAASRTSSCCVFATEVVRSSEREPVRRRISASAALARAEVSSSSFRTEAISASCLRVRSRKSSSRFHCHAHRPQRLRRRRRRERGTGRVIAGRRV